jgi:DNA-binding MarR family transcriptional regulator
MAGPSQAKAPTAVPALDQSELKRYPGYLFARARYLAFRTFEQHIGAEYELKPVEFSLLLLVSSNRDVTQAQLAQALGVAPPNMTGIFKRLQARGLVERTPAERDRRMQYITLTDAGASLIGRAHAIGKTMDKSWLGRLSKAEQAMLLELLDKVAIPASAA